MANLPPLRTVRDPRSGMSDPEPVVGAIKSPAPPIPAAAPAARPSLGRRLNAAAAKLLGELEVEGLLAPGAADELVEKAGDRTPQLNSADRVLDALVQYGMLTGYQRTRVGAGNLHGLVFGGYRVLDRLGGGSMGIVFLAEHLLLRKKVAVKVLPEEDTTRPEALARFRAEAALLARVSHPHVIGVHDAGTIPSPGAGYPTLHYMVMELVTGKDIEQFVYDNGVPSVQLACAFARQAAAGLAAAHAVNLAHRDVKPSNLLLTDSRRVKVSDFGLARHFASTLTPRPGILGSVEFMAPEQSIDAATAGPPADVYGLGATLFWVLTGKLPFPPTSKLSEALEAIRTMPPFHVREFKPDVPDGLDALVFKMMKRNPTDRPTAWDVVAALEKYADPTTAPGYESGKAPPAGTADAARYAIHHLEDALKAKKETADQAAAAVLAVLAKMAQTRGEAAAEQGRVQAGVRVLVGRLNRHPAWLCLADPKFVADLVRSAAARNCGLAAVPDVLVRRGVGSNPAEVAALETHAAAGADMLADVANEYGAHLPFLRTARAVVRHHHERWDGTGYPDKLAREAIPHAARLVALADSYDALRRAGADHTQAVAAIIRDRATHFDPLVLDAFRSANLDFEEIYREAPV